MGFFSWKTMDTDKSISNDYSSRSTFRVHMIDDKGNVWTEDSYEGYGVFGGKDYYELLAEMNGVDIDKDIENYSDKMRMAGIELAFAEGHHDGYNPNIKHPNLSEDPNWKWRNDIPESCSDQGFFYDDDVDEYDADDDFKTYNEAPYGDD